MTKYTPEFKEQVKQAYLSSTDSLVVIAAQFGVGERTVEGWSKDGGWDALKKAQKVVPIGQPRASSKPSSSTRIDEPVRVRPRRQRGDIDELEIVENAIVNLDLLIAGMGGMSDDGRPVDTRGIGTTAGALVKLLEYRRKIQPPTAAELAEQMITLGIPPHEFVAELKRQWQVRA